MNIGYENDPFLKQTLVIAFVRLFISLIFLFIKQIPLLYRVLIVVFLFDGIDSCEYPLGSPPARCVTYGYIATDKIIDIIILAIIAFKLIPEECSNQCSCNCTCTNIGCNIKNGIFCPTCNYVDPTILKFIQFLVVYRIIGVILYLFTKNDKILILFPNFSDFIIVAALLGAANLPIIIILMILKMVQEFYVHWNEVFWKIFKFS